MNIKENLDYYGSSVKTVLKNVCEFTEASALSVVSGYAIYQALHLMSHSFWYKGLLLAGVIIALMAFVLLVRHFNRPTVTETASKKK